MMGGPNPITTARREKILSLLQEAKRYCTVKFLMRKLGKGFGVLGREVVIRDLRTLKADDKIELIKIMDVVDTEGPLLTKYRYTALLSARIKPETKPKRGK
jgi:hypothetical protein